jgi:hypothetical protein
MPTYSGFTNIAGVAPSADPHIAALATGARWDTGALTFSFPAADALWADGYPPGIGTQPPDVGFTPLTPANQDQFRFAIGKWADLINMSITETADGTNVGDIRAAYYGPGNTYDGFAYFPSQSAWGGDVWFAPSMAGYKPGFEPGWPHPVQLMLHEIGHALGLKHPNEGDPQLPHDLMDVRYTVMLLNHYSFAPTTPMLLDVQAIQYMYGANHSTRAGNDTYQYDDARPYHETIWDGAGIDTLAYTGANAARIDLHEGHASAIGLEIRDEFTNTAIDGNVWIAFGVNIENAVGGSGNDVIVGNDGANRLDGGGGSNRLDGQGGTDTAVIHAARSGLAGYSLADGVLTLNTASDTQTLANIERVELSDAWYALDTQAPAAGTAGGAAWEAAALFRAAFGVLPGMADLSHWTAQADQSDGMGALGQRMIDFYAPGLSSAALVTDLYVQLLHAAPSQETVQGFVDQIGAGKPFASQGDLFAYAASLSLKTDAMAGFIGSIQQLDPSWF